MSHVPTPAQLRMLANLRDGRPIGQGVSQAEVVEHNCMRAGLLKPWPFPGAGRIAEAGWAALDAAREDTEAEFSVGLAALALGACYLLVGSLAVPFVFN